MIKAGKIVERIDNINKLKLKYGSTITEYLNTGIRLKGSVIG